MLTLAIDTSTNILSLALVQDGIVLSRLDEPTKNNQSAILMSRVETLLKSKDFRATDLTNIAVAIGPGSYTGIRVGVAAAKSLGYALNIPVTGISSLAVMAKASGVDTGVVASMIDARRGTVFAGVYGSSGNVIVAEGHYDLDDFLSQLNFSNAQVTFFGDAATLYKEKLLEQAKNVLVIAEDEFSRSKAEALVELANKGLSQKNIHELVPNYLRKTEAELNLE